MQDKKFIKDAAVVSAGGFVSKAIGALYRVPLAGFIGCKGLGLYQLVFPLYCLLYSASACGASSAVAKLAAERGRGGAEGAYTAAMRIFTKTGALCGGIMFLLAFPLSVAYGESRLVAGYMLIAPAVLFSSLVAVYRGYFQGRGYMLPGVAADVVEQGVKAISSLTAAFIFRADVYKAVCFVLFSVSVSSGAALVFMRRTYARLKTASPLFCLAADGRKIIKTALPVTISSFIFPLSHTLDGALALRRLALFAPSAISQFGIFSGAALTIASLPVALCYGLAAAILPKISSSVGYKERNRNVLLSLSATAAVSIPCAALLYFAAPLTRFLYPSFSNEEKALLIKLVKILSFSAATKSCAQTLSACLTGRGAAWKGAISSAVAVSLKTAVYLIFLDEKNGAYCLASAVNVCYFSLFVVNLSMNLFTARRKEKNYDYDSRVGRGRRRSYEKRRKSYSFGRKGNIKERKDAVG